MINRILQSTFLKFTSIVFVGNLFSQLLIFLSFALFARLFTKTDLGIYTIYISLSILFSIVATGRYELALMLPSKKKETSGLLMVSLGLAFIFALIFYVVLSLLPLNEYFDRFEKIESVLPLLPLSIFLLAAFQSFLAFNNKLSRFKRNAFLKFTQALSMLLVSLFLAYKIGYTAYALVLAWTISQALVFSISLVLFLLEEEKNSWQELKLLMKEYERYPKVSLVSNFLNSFSIELPNYFIPILWSAEIQALYAYGLKAASMPRNFVGSAVGEVFFNTSSKIAVDNPEILLKHLRKITTILFAFSISIYAIGIASSQFLFPIFFGADYAAAVPYFNWVALASIFLLVQSPISIISDVVNKLKAPLIFNIVSIIVKITVLYAAYYFLKSPVHMIALYAIANAALSLFWIGHLFKMAKDFSSKENPRIS